MKKLLFLAWLCCGVLGFSQTVQISDTLRNPNNTLASGRIIVTASIPFTAGDGTAVSTGPITYTIPTTGIINLSLHGNVGAAPAGTSYQARYILNTGSQYTETWVIPASGPVALADIRVSAVPSPNVLINPLTQLLSTGGIGCLQSDGSVITWTTCAEGGTGITSLNGLLGAVQTFIAGTAGADFGISSAGTAHTFNLPSSSGSNRGLLTSADWTTFNGKQPVLSSSGAVANQFLTGFTAPNTFTRAQPSCADLSDSDTGCSTPGSSITAREVDGAPSVAGIAVIEFDQVDGFVLTNPSGTTVRLDLVSVPDAAVSDLITLTNITQVTNRGIGDTTGDLAPARVDDGSVAATLALFSGAAAAAGFRAIEDADVPDGITVTLAATASALAANGANCSAGSYPLGVNAAGAVEDCTVAGTGSAAFSDLTSGTNTGAAMVVGTGGSLAVSGSGTIAATAGDSATAFFSSGTLEDARLSANVSLLGQTIGAAELETDSVSADELNATGVEAELEAVQDLQDFQGAVTDAQVPNNITVDLATVATTANAGDSATSFFPAGTIEDARLSAAVSLLGQTITTGEIVDDTILPADLDAADAPADEECVTYEETGPAFEYQACGSGGGYATVDDEDTPLTQRTTLNFEGAGVTCADDTDQTTCTIPGGAGSGDSLTVNTTAVVDPDLIDSATIAVNENLVPAPDTIDFTVVANSLTSTHIDETGAFGWTGAHTFGLGVIATGLSTFTGSGAILEYDPPADGFALMRVRGPDATTRGAFVVSVEESDGGNSIQPLSLDDTGAVDLGVVGQTVNLLGNPIIAPVAGIAPTASGQVAYDSTANALEYGDNGTNRTVANLDEAQTLSGPKTLTAPVIADFTASAHDHGDADDGGAIVAAAVPANLKYSTIGITIDGGGVAITTGWKGAVDVFSACTISTARVRSTGGDGTQTGSISIRVFNDSFSTSVNPTTVISASAPITLTTAIASTDTTLTGWDVTLDAGSVVGFEVLSVTTTTRATVTLRCERT